MVNKEEKAVTVILVGGHTKGTRFRILSFNTPKPLFPLAGQPMVGHLINSCKRVSAESAHQFGELVADPVTKELLPYTEKPETFVSDLINRGVYVFTRQILVPSKRYICTWRTKLI